MPFSPWALESSDLLNELGSDKVHGLKSADISARQKQEGKNLFEINVHVSQLELFFRQFRNPMVYTLLFATIVSWGLGEHLDAFAILFIVLLNAIMGYFQESKAEASIEALKKLAVPKARVIRDGKIQIISAEDIVRGDILFLEAGDYVVADSRLIEGFSLSSNEAILTGESFPVQKTTDVLPVETELADKKNMLFASTAITEGTGKAVVTSIGLQTEIGKIAGLLKTKNKTVAPLETRMEKVSKFLLVIGLLIMGLLIIVGIAKGKPWQTILMSSIGLAVAAIPEGLPTVVTLALTLAVRRMTKKRAIVRNMAAVETLGSTDVICTDKTGTLTTGMMSVREIYTQEHGLKAENDFSGNDEFYKCMVLCNNASINQGSSGDPTEVALLFLAESHAKDVEEIRRCFPRIHEISFDSDRKRMSVAVSDASGTRVYTKGAPESILMISELDEEVKNQVLKVVHELSRKGQRTLAFGMKTLGHEKEKFEEGLTFLGLVGISDPPRQETIKVIEDCKKAGIKVVMITGDHHETARAIGLELGIVIPGSFDAILTGKELESLGEQELKTHVEKTAVYARVNPEHKLKIVEALKSNGHIVAMTGDGVNDAPALKVSSIGVAMGKGGTEVARQAASIILTDDNFSTIVSAVEEGRAVYGNIKRTIQYLLSTNLAEVLIMFGAAIFGGPMPVTPVALLYINLVTDGFPSLALSAEPVREGFIRESERPSAESFFDRAFLLEVVSVAIAGTTVCLGIYFYHLPESELTAKTYLFNMLVYFSLFRTFSCRSTTKTIFELPVNWWLIFSVLIPITLQVTLQHVHFFQKIFHVRAMGVSETLWICLMSMIPMILVELSKVLRNFLKR